MKKQLLYIIATLVLLLSACTEDGERETTFKEKEDPATTENEADDENAANDEESEDVETADEPNDTAEPAEKLYELDANWYLQPIGEANPKAVLLTIDDAPDKYALDMAKTLKELDAPAIFFVNGHFIDSDEDKAVLKEIHDMGFAIGNHTNTHVNLQQVSEAEQEEEIISVNEAIEEVIGERPIFFRAPFGNNTDFSEELVKNEGMLLMNWSYGYDWEKQYMEAGPLADIMVSNEFLRDGANLLMHDREWTADALKDIVEGLRAKGYDFIDPATIQGVEQ
ncbi:polysaccharide deacetylase family protein [Sporosarcina jiandibaonis]|uniref:polysaccharide deacetylase family protein n=1 Tax=Sporosarcina jiandibaonis TaxID=2715535 RepID=UPI001552A309|nr:polysaccharide deacetylase family protein [Sporosarcina jiandibaonis]